MNISTILAITFGVLAFLIVLLTLYKTIKVVPQTHFYIIERLGSYKKTLTHGLHILIPFIDRISLVDNLKEKVFDFPAQDVITRDNATIKVDTVVYAQIVDPKLFAYGAEKPFKAIENLSATTIRNLLGELELDETLTSRDTINAKLAAILDDASDPWGIKVHRVELKNIEPPKEIQNAMEKQMRAEREKRANILEAEGFKLAAILEAEGKKAAALLNSEGIKRSSILEAEGQKQAIELLTSANLTKEVLTFKSIEQFGKMADGKATKIIIPPNLHHVAASMASFAEIFNSEITPDKTPTEVIK